MKALYSILIVVVTFYSCTDVIDVTVSSEEPRLVVEASLDWEKGTAGNEQEIKLSMSKPYFDDTSSDIVVGANVQVTNLDTGAVFVFEDQNDGTYTINNFVPITYNEYQLDISVAGEQYTAREILIPVVDINEITQSTENGFNSDALELNIYFNDPPDEDNYYLFKFQEVGDLLPELEEITDEFTNGNEMSIFYEKDDDDEKFEVGDTVLIEFYGTSERYNNFMRLLIEQSESSGDPFSTTPVAIKGNCLNLTNPDKKVFGYFRLTQVVKTSYTFQ